MGGKWCRPVPGKVWESGIEKLESRASWLNELAGRAEGVITGLGENRTDSRVVKRRKGKMNVVGCSVLRSE